jgi:hypothetical protein
METTRIIGRDNPNLTFSSFEPVAATFEIYRQTGCEHVATLATGDDEAGVILLY